MRDIPWEVGADRDTWNRTIRLWIHRLTKDDRRELIAHTSILIPDGESAPPTVELAENEAQRLIDALWHCGLRPSEGSGSAGMMAAVQKHLEDMREIAFAGLPGRKKP